MKHPITMLGALLGAAFLVFAFFRVGAVPMALFFTFLSWAVQDAMKGKVLVASLLPTIILPVYYYEITLTVFVVPFAAILVIWWLAWLARRAWGDPPGILALGFGDVVAVPFALALGAILFPFWGIVVFGAAAAGAAPFMLRKKQIRLIPWLLPGVLVNFIVALLL